MSIRQVTVIGAGSMGHQIAMLSALAGYETYLQDIEQSSLDRAKESLNFQMGKWVTKGKIDQNSLDQAFARLHVTTDLKEAVRETDFVIEAIVEKLDVKRELFAKLDEFAPEHAILTTNSSTIVNSKIADATNRPEKICNMHFFFPPLVMDCVEVVKSEQTSVQTAEIAMAVSEKMNRTAVLLHKEISGFIANRILGALTTEAVKLYEEGYASFEDIDLICTKALNHPIGPFALMDLSGIDVAYFVHQQRFAESEDPADLPPACIEEKVKAGELGRKTGKGWYDYPKQGVKN
ncbi:3-hydroxyacyl-CoA dehydrogenase family protein [Bacillus sp. FJAT-45037]|uniref:3-hydroxyacyl-CoA dehydrogenase family protein n=1 Tax=Bacillus sp. FJAT-45037 TaxID=2011007 RepID=UPI003FA4BCAD